MIDPADSARVTFQRVRRHFSPALGLAGKIAGQSAVEISASGCTVTLSDGRRMLDFGSYAVTLLGHRNPAVVEAVRQQLETMPTSSRSLANPLSALAAECLVDYLGDSLTRVFFGVNGSDAVEAAIKLARLATGRTTVVAVRGGFHGKSLGALALTHHERFRAGLTELLNGVVHVDPHDAGAVAAVVDREPVAAVIFEPLQGENGVQPLDARTLAQWCADAHRAGAFAISDEVQVGLRRCGPRSVALDQKLPIDAVLLGKPLGGGVIPLSAAVCSEHLYEPLLIDPFRHSSTFSGHPLCVAAIPAALQALELHNWNGVVIAKLMAEALTSLQEKFPDLIADVRGRGLIWGIDLRSPDIAGEFQIGLAQRGLLVSPCLSSPTTLRLLPPLVATAADIQEAIDILSGTADQVLNILRVPANRKSQPYDD